MKSQPNATQEAVNDQQTVTGERYPDVYYEYSPDAVANQYQEKDNIFAYECENGMALKVEVVNASTFRFRYAPEGQFERDFSYALDPAARSPFPRTTVGGDATHFFLKTEQLICRISKENLKVSLFDANNQEPVLEDAAPFYARRSIRDGFSHLRIRKVAAQGEAYFGLGDKTGSANLRGQKLENWNTDSFAYKSGQDPLYRSIPFYYGLVNNKGYGIFLHNTHRTHFSFDEKNEGEASFWAEGGEMDYFFIYGPSLLQVAERYARLTGRPELPPLWALGFHQCRWSYYPENRVHELAQEFRKQKIPCDAIYLDIDYMDGYRCFTWNKDYFPDPKRMIAGLKEQGFQTVVMIDPGIRVDPNYQVYQDGMERKAFCYRPSGEVMRGPVWPPDCVFPDFTAEEVRQWWGKLYEELYTHHGVSGFWNDMNEPAVFKLDQATFPDEILHHNEGQAGNHRRIHNVYGQQMSRATFEGLKQLQPDKRPFVLTRATFSGGQRFASVWTGDNIASWEHLRLANLQCQRLSASGFSFVGSDIGGFSQQPDGELMARWLQLGVFHPLYRIHSMGNNIDGAAEAEAEAIQQAEQERRLDQEPWSFGDDYTEHARAAIELRYQLLPYLYTAFREYTRSGRPVIRSLFLYDHTDPRAVSRENEFLFGGQLLAMPVTKAGATQQKGYLPKGRWLDYYNGTVYEGQNDIHLPVDLGSIPLFVEAGAVIPNYPVQQYTAEKKFETITLRVYYGKGESELYEDAGEGYGYESGAFSHRTFRTNGEENRFSLTQQQEGSYRVDYSRFSILLFGLPFQPKACKVDGKPISLKEESSGYSLEVPAGFRKLDVY